MIKDKNELNDFLQYEKKRYGSHTGYLYYLLGSESAVIWSFQKRLRKTEYYYNSNKKIRYALSNILLHKKQNKYGLHISKNVFDKGLKIMHLGQILTNDRVKVGKNCTLHIGTALVAQGTNAGVPILGDNIVLGVGAIVLGKVTIADGIAIGANSLVNKSFEEQNIAIAGSPAKKISDNGNFAWHKKMTKEEKEFYLNRQDFKQRLRRNLKLKVSKMEAEDYIHIYGKTTKPEEVLNNADLFVFSSDFEVMQKDLIQAMAIGLPCILTDCPTGFKELIGNDKRGIMVPVGDSQEMSKVILFLMKNPMVAIEKGKKLNNI